MVVELYALIGMILLCLIVGFCSGFLIGWEKCYQFTKKSITKFLN